MDRNQSPFELLRQKEIMQILDGDTVVADDDGVSLSMPYLSGPALVGICNRFGLPINYGSASRWMYVDEMLEHCIENETMGSLLAFLFSKPQFSEALSGKDVDEIERLYKKIVDGAISSINGLLYFSGKELLKNGDSFAIVDAGENVIVSTPAIENVDRDYVRRMSERAREEVVAGNYDSAVTKSRTLLEEVFCHAIEKKGVVPSSKGDIGALYKQVKELYNMHANSDMDKRVNTLLSGLEKIVSAIAEMRNKCSDSHGVGQRRINLQDYHALLAVNAATTMAEFVLSVSLHATKGDE